MVAYIEEAVSSGARKRYTREEVGHFLRILERWIGKDEVKADQHPTEMRPEPRNKLPEFK